MWSLQSTLSHLSPAPRTDRAFCTSCSFHLEYSSFLHVVISSSFFRPQFSRQFCWRAFLPFLLTPTHYALGTSSTSPFKALSDILIFHSPGGLVINSCHFSCTVIDMRASNFCIFLFLTCRIVFSISWKLNKLLLNEWMRRWMTLLKSLHTSLGSVLFYSIRISILPTFEGFY